MTPSSNTDIQALSKLVTAEKQYIDLLTLIDTKFKTQDDIPFQDWLSAIRQLIQAHQAFYKKLNHSKDTNHHHDYLNAMKDWGNTLETLYINYTKKYYYVQQHHGHLLCTSIKTIIKDSSSSSSSSYTVDGILAAPFDQLKSYKPIYQTLSNTTTTFQSTIQSIDTLLQQSPPRMEHSSISEDLLTFQKFVDCDNVIDLFTGSSLDYQLRSRPGRIALQDDFLLMPEDTDQSAMRIHMVLTSDILMICKQMVESTGRYDLLYPPLAVSDIYVQPVLLDRELIGEYTLEFTVLSKKLTIRAESREVRNTWTGMSLSTTAKNAIKTTVPLSNIVSAIAKTQQSTPATATADKGNIVSLDNTQKHPPSIYNNNRNTISLMESSDEEDEDDEDDDDDEDSDGTSTSTPSSLDKKSLPAIPTHPQPPKKDTIIPLPKDIAAPVINISLHDENINLVQHAAKQNQQSKPRASSMRAPLPNPTYKPTPALAPANEQKLLPRTSSIRNRPTTGSSNSSSNRSPSPNKMMMQRPSHQQMHHARSPSPSSSSSSSRQHQHRSSSMNPHLQQQQQQQQHAGGRQRMMPSPQQHARSTSPHQRPPSHHHHHHSQRPPPHQQRPSQPHHQQQRPPQPHHQRPPQPHHHHQQRPPPQHHHQQRPPPPQHHQHQQHQQHHHHHHQRSAPVHPQQHQQQAQQRPSPSQQHQPQQRPPPQQHHQAQQRSLPPAAIPAASTSKPLPQTAVAAPADPANATMNRPEMNTPVHRPMPPTPPPQTSQFSGNLPSKDNQISSQSALPPGTRESVGSALRLSPEELATPPRSPNPYNNQTNGIRQVLFRSQQCEVFRWKDESWYAVEGQCLLEVRQTFTNRSCVAIRVQTTGELYLNAWVLPQTQIRLASPTDVSLGLVMGSQQETYLVHFEQSSEAMDLNQVLQKMHHAAVVAARQPNDGQRTLRSDPPTEMMMAMHMNDDMTADDDDYDDDDDTGAMAATTLGSSSTESSSSGNRRTLTRTSSLLQSGQEPTPIPQTLQPAMQCKCKLFVQNEHSNWSSFGSVQLVVSLQLPSRRMHIQIDHDKKRGFSKIMTSSNNNTSSSPNSPLSSSSSSSNNDTNNGSAATLAPTTTSNTLVSATVYSNNVERLGLKRISFLLVNEQDRTSSMVYMVQLREEESGNTLYDYLKVKNAQNGW